MAGARSRWCEPIAANLAKGTLPLALFGEHRYAAIMGRIAMPSLVAQAASPSVGAILIEKLSASGALAAVFAVAITNVIGWELR